VNLSSLEIGFGIVIAVNLLLNISSQKAQAILGWTAVGIAWVYGVL